MGNQKLINVTDLSKYLYCQRQFYLEKVLGIKKPVTKEMMEGRIIHEVLEIFSKCEREIVEKLENSSDLKKEYLILLNTTIEKVMFKNNWEINQFSLNKDLIIDKIISRMNKEIELRIISIKNALAKGFEKEELWNNLEPKYFSEFQIISESLGLKGRIDRLILNNGKAELFELKTREISKVYESDEIQIVAYALLIEVEFNQKIDFGFLEAGNQVFKVEIDDNKRKKVICLINEMQERLSKKYPSNFSKCERCSYKKECEDLE